jgi:type II pantothenate kinase
MGFNDIFCKVKEKENAESLKSLDALIDNLSNLSGKELVMTLLENVIAGNMYDWGSNEIQEMITSGKLDFKQAKVYIDLVLGQSRKESSTKSF